jgi:hypothetical protein
MIPFATLFSAVFFVIYLGHSYFVKLEELNKIEKLITNPNLYRETLDKLKCDYPDSEEE